MKFAHMNGHCKTYAYDWEGPSISSLSDYAYAYAYLYFIQHPCITVSKYVRVFEYIVSVITIIVFMLGVVTNAWISHKLIFHVVIYDIRTILYT